MDIIADIFTYNKSLANNIKIREDIDIFAEYTGSSIHLLPSIQAFDINRLVHFPNKKKHKRTPYITLIAENLFNPEIYRYRNNSLTKTFLSSDLKVNIYQTIEEFLEDSWPKIKFINEEWIPDNLDDDYFEHIAWRYLNRVSRMKTLNWFKEITEQTIVDYQVISCHHLHDSHGDRLIYELSKNIYKVCLPRECEFDIKIFTDQNFQINIQCFARLNLNIIICDKRIIDLEIANVTLQIPQKENIGDLRI
ncbi:hypothetical protein [Pedobacter metabolipauper]|uniref:Uncharacterized protein n=1 Tax=Pedobacter metabolipauper TaxID=425513 RepID=A0A4R6T0D2_9SPHI|nr:hypothetical protein [Pedobacter metabolipauper]TDQ11479.1 hypothetical protein ATK78_0601 [Pedobacter metabolipauper]